MSRADLFAILQRNLQRHFRNTEHCALGFSCSARNNISRGSANGRERNYRREINARGPTKQLYSSFFAVLFPVMEIMGRSEGESRFSKRRNNTGIEIEREDSKVLGNFGFETLKFIGMLWIVMFFIHLTILVKYPKRSGNWIWNFRINVSITSNFKKIATQRCFARKKSQTPHSIIVKE